MRIPAILHHALVSLVVTAAVVLAPVTPIRAQSTTRRSLPSDAEIINFLVEGEEWAYDSQENCSSYKTVFYYDGSYVQLRYVDTFSDWNIDSAAGGSEFTVSNGRLRLNDPRFEPVSFEIVSASSNQINAFREAGGEEISLSYINCP